MAYTRPTKAAFAEIFTDFASVTDAQFNYWIERAERVITSEFGDDQLHGTQLLTAHYLVKAGLGTGVSAQRVRDFGGANRVKSGSLELGWSDGGVSAGGKSTGSIYGDEVLALIKSVKGGPSVTGTGTVPARVNMGGINGLA
jgi:hypothetical protein